MSRIVITDEFCVRALDLLHGEMARTHVHRILNGNSYLRRYFRDLGPHETHRVQVRVSDEELYKLVMGAVAESDVARLQILPRNERPDLCPGDIVFVVAPPEPTEARLGQLDVHEIRLGRVDQEEEQAA
jgi:hypothetical protein